MAAVPALLVFLLLHGLFFHDVAAGGRSLSAATYTAGLTPRGPLDAPVERTPPHLLDVEGAAWVDEPSPRLARAAFAAGELPLWNPGEGLGIPLAANLNSGAANPLQLLVNLVPTPWVADLFYLGRLLLLALFTWAFLRALALSSLAAVVGASIVTYGGYSMAWIAHHPLSSEIFLPLMLLGFERGREGRARGWLLLALAACCSLLGGKLQASALCFAFVGAYALRRAPSQQGGAGVSTMHAATMGLVLAGALAAFLLVPAIELTTRASGLTLGGRSQLAGFTVPWPTLASLAVPTLFVAPGHAFADDLLLTPAIGIAAVVLAAVGAAASAAPQVRMARLCVGWALVLMLRNAGVFGDVATGLPGLRGILFVKYTFTAVFALGAAAAIGLDAVSAGRVRRERAVRAVTVSLAAIGGLVAASLVMPAPATFARALLVPGLIALLLAVTAGLWQGNVIGGRSVAVLLAILVVGELWSFAPRTHPPRLDPYRPPAFVEFLRSAPAGRVIADPDLLVPLTSAAAGLHDVRSIDVLTPGSYYAFFTRLVSFCTRVIHFTVDPDVVVAASAPALDLAGVRYLATRQPLAFDDLALRVRRQVGRERTARLFAGLARLHTKGGSLAIGPVASADDVRFAFTLTTPFALELLAESEAPELAWGTLFQGSTAGVRLHVAVAREAAAPQPEALVVDAAGQWTEHRVTLGEAGTPRRIRLRIAGEATDGVPTQVSLGDLGFGPGAAVERRLAAERAGRHEAEVASLRPVFRDAELDVVVYENTNALPRAFRVTQVEAVASLDAALTRLGDGFDFRTAVLVSSVEASGVTAALANAGTQPSAGILDRGTVSVHDETPNHLSIETAGPSPAVLVLADLAYPGWQATLDGRTVPILTVDGVLRGVVVPGGTHAIVFRYRPASLWFGAALSALALVALVPYGRWGARAHADGDPA